MDIRIYIGGHKATTQHFVDALKENAAVLEAEKIAYTPAIDDTFHSIFRASKATSKGENPKTAGARLLQHLTGVSEANTFIIIDNRVMGQEHRPFEKELFFPRPGNLIKQIQNIFRDNDLQLFVETRDISSLIPSCYSEKIFSYLPGSFDDFLATVDIESLRWSSFIDRAQGRNTPIPATAWRYEDYSHIWRDVIGAITKLPRYQDLMDPPNQLEMTLDLQKALLFDKYLQKYPVNNRAEFDTLKTLFLEQELTPPKKLATPAWTPERMQELTHSYDDDWYYIERMDDVKTIQPRNHTHSS
jgi:hypothetical protein